MTGAAGRADSGTVPSTAVPAVAPGAAHHERLLVRLDAALRHPLSFVTAPAGYGKTTLVAQWCHERCTVPVDWLSIGADDPAAAVERALVDTFRTGSDDCVVVIDDARPDGGARWGDLVQAVAGGSGNGPRVVILSRARPHRLAAALRLRGRVDQIDELDLALDRSEATSLLKRASGVDLPADVVGQIVARLEGWIAGIAMMAMAVAHERDRVALEARIASGYELIDEFLVAEVVDRLPEGLRSFALAVSCLETVDGAVSDVITGRNDGRIALDALRSAGDFVVPAPDGAGWFRFHPLFRQTLERLAEEEDPTEHGVRLRRAADWLTEREMVVPAAACLVRLRDWDALAILVASTQRIFLAGQPPRDLLELLDHIPPEYHRAHGNLAIAHAGLDLWAGRVSAARETLERLRDHVPLAGQVAIEWIRSSEVSWVPEVEHCLVAAERALALAADTDAAEYRAGRGDDIVHGCHTTAALAAAYLGQWSRGSPHLVDIPPEVAGGVSPTLLVRMLGRPATYFALAGEAVKACAEADATFTVAERGPIDPMFTADARYARGEAMRLMARTDEALRELQRARELAMPNDRRNLVASAVASLALAHVDAGRPERALDVLDEHRTVSAHRNPPTVEGMIRAAEARARTARGELKEAARALRGAPDTSVVSSARFAIALHEGDRAAASDILSSWPDEPTVMGRLRQATAHVALLSTTGRADEALATLRAVLEAAAGHELVQPIIELGPVMAPLLRLARTRNLDPRATVIADRALAVLALAGAGNDGLTAREHAVMDRLSTGRTIREIAGEMFLSVNTIKTHTRSIYRKLGVSSRQEAVRVWREANPA